MKLSFAPMILFSLVGATATLQASRGDHFNKRFEVP